MTDRSPATSVVRQRDVARVALHDGPTLRAKYEGVITPAVQKEDHLATVFERGVVSCLNDPSCSSSITIKPSRRVGAKTAERAPTTTSTSPAAMLRQCRCRSESLKWLCSTATFGNRRLNRRIVWGVRQISGTR